MMTADTLERIRIRRKNYLTRKNSELNVRIKRIRTELVKLTFQNPNNPAQKLQLQEELAGLKSKLYRIIN